MTIVDKRSVRKISKAAASLDKGLWHVNCITIIKNLFLKAVKL